jgi:predicted flap endonuclease-1-like 5' DNA nuclease
MTKVSDIEGIGSANAQKLSDIGISTTEALLKQGASKKGRKEIADKSSISEKL